MLYKEDIKYTYPNIKLLMTSSKKVIDKKNTSTVWFWSDIETDGTLQLVYIFYNDLQKPEFKDLPPIIRL